MAMQHEHAPGTIAPPSRPTRDGTPVPRAGAGPAPVTPVPGAPVRSAAEATRGAGAARPGVAKPGVATTGLLVVTMIIGYEWLISGLVKFVRGGFPAGLAEELLKKSAGTAAWYGSFVKSAVIPNAVPLGYVIETAELLAGVALLTGPLVWMFAWDRVPDRVRSAVLLAIAAAAIGATVLAVNLHFANGASHPWLIPGDAFDQGIDLDSVLPAIQLVIATVSLILFTRLRRAHAGATPGKS